MSQSLCFNNFKFSPVTHQNLPWIRSTELAHALGYKREDILGKLYRKNADEFTPDMTQLIEIVDNTGSVFPVKLRIFSLRGCHLLAMFARTPVAKAFRKWVLDVIERYGDRVPVDAQTPPTGTLSRIITGELHKRHSTVLDAISRAAAVCPQRDAFVRGNYVDAKGQRCPQYMVSREGIIFLS